MVLLQEALLGPKTLQDFKRGRLLSRVLAVGLSEGLLCRDQAGWPGPIKGFYCTIITFDNALWIKPQPLDGDGGSHPGDAAHATGVVAAT